MKGGVIEIENLQVAFHIRDAGSLFAFEIPTYVNIQRLFSIMVPSTFVQRLV